MFIEVILCEEMRGLEASGRPASTHSAPLLPRPRAFNATPSLSEFTISHCARYVV